QYQLSYRSTSNGGSLVIDVTAGGTTLSAQTRAGTTGAAAAPAPVAAAAGLLGLALLLIFGQQDNTLDSRLSPYANMGLGPEEADGGEAAGPTFIESGIVKRAVGLTSKVAGRGDLLVKVERLLEQSNIPLRPAEALFFYAA